MSLAPTLFPFGTCNQPKKSVPACCPHPCPAFLPPRQTTYAHYHEYGFDILAFPCNDFNQVRSAAMLQREGRGVHQRKESDCACSARGTAAPAGI